MKKDRKKLIRNFALELGLYALLVFGYFWTILQLLGDWLAQLYATNLPLYAVIALLLIVAQGVLLESVTTLLVRLLRLERLE
ncbi:MAG: hypothetical protein H6666_00825 [Ardenticatenaceae bacterium]|nr:hypothetical protein [Anaerolineales bacterium]MCB8916441.1 hypothetical protein [Ardenticatenaceae bacterium]